MKRNTFLAPAIFLAALIALPGCHKNVPTSATPASATRPAAVRFAPIPGDALPNAHRVTDKVICGGLPDGERGFRQLQSLGVKTVISVDGITPQVDLAHEHGMHYVHLPFGYDGVPQAQGQAIAKAIDEMPGPIYIHCHHGQHRAPAATAVACVMNGSLPPDEALPVLQTFGTGANYQGLWQSARNVRPLDPAMLKNLKITFIEIAPIPAMAHTMVHVDDNLDLLKAAQKQKWPSPSAESHTALQLEELLTEVGRSPAAASKPEDFHHLLTQAVTNLHQLRTVLRDQPFKTAPADAAFKQVSESCTACHRVYRDKK